MNKGSTGNVVFIAAMGSVVATAVCVSGCGINSSFSDAQQQRDLVAKMAWVDKAINVAERHNLAYRVEVDASGKPSIGETVDLYLDSGISARVLMFGNAAAAPKSNPADTTTQLPGGADTDNVDVQTNDQTASTTVTSGTSSGAKSVTVAGATK